MKGTLDSEFLNEVSIYLNNGTINTQEYKAALKDIHTQHVRQYIRSREPSKVLNAPTSAVSLLERNLDRRARKPHYPNSGLDIVPTLILICTVSNLPSTTTADNTLTTPQRHCDDTMRICFPSQCVITITLMKLIE